MHSHGKPRSTARLLMIGWAAAACLAGLPAGAAPAACNLQQMEIPVRIVDRRPIATLTLNGTEVPMLVDSGAFYSMLSPATAAQLKLQLRQLPWGMRIQGYTGEIEARRAVVEEVGLLGAKLSNIEFIVGGNELGAGIMGILGRNILSLADTEYDLAHGAVRLSFPKGDCDDTNFAHWAGEAPVVVVPLARNEPRTDTTIRVSVAVNGRTTSAVLDTGAPRTSLTRRAAERAGIQEKDLTLVGRAGGAGEGRVQRHSAAVALFELGGERIKDSRLSVDDVSSSGHDMLIGMDYFLSHRVYVSRLQRKLYVTWNGQPVFAPAGASAGASDLQYATKPPELAAGDADALARRGAAALAAGEPARALDDLNRAISLAPATAPYLFDRARVHLAMRQPRPALADLDEALRLDPALADARARRSRLRAELGDRAGAEADLAQLDASLPPTSHLRLGMAHLHAGFTQLEPALKQFDLWIAARPDDAGLPAALSSRCWLRTRLNVDLPQALKDCQRAVSIDGGDPALHGTLGWALLRTGDADRARKAFDRAIALRPQATPLTLYGRGLALTRLGDTEAAQRDLAAARAARQQVDEDARKLGLDTAPPP